MSSSRKTRTVLDTILHLMLDNEDIASKARRISAARLLEKLKSDKVDKTAKLIFIGLAISEILDKTKLSDLAALFNRIISQKEGRMDNEKVTTIENQKGPPGKYTDSFVTKYKIREIDKQLIEKVIEGVSLKNFEDVLNISGSNANKKIRALWQRLGLKNREQLIFVAGWMRLISFDLPCLEAEEEIPNLVKK